ncbi:hypothetical protein ACKKBF_B03495 [Auxenochlorella protothecoides x Auxenochlorella symbiontica]
MAFCGIVLLRNCIPLFLRDSRPVVDATQVSTGTLSGSVHMPAHPDVSQTVLEDEVEAQKQAAKQVSSRVLLRMETMTSATVIWLQVGVALSFALVDAFTITIFLQKFQYSNDLQILSELTSWFIVQLALVSVFFFILLTCAASWFQRVWKRQSAHRVWTQRQRLFVLDAAVLISLQSLVMALLIVSQSIAIAVPCPWFKQSVSLLSFIRWTLTNSILAWMCVMMRGMCWYRGSVQLPDPDRQLTIDAPWRRQAWANLPTLLIFLSTETVVVAKLAYRWIDVQEAVGVPACRTYPYDCTPSTGEFVINIITTVCLLVYAVYYIYLVVQARADHAKVPFTRYRVTYLYVQMHARHGIFIVVLLLVVSTVLRFVESKSCWSFADIQFGLIPTQLAITVLVCVVSILTAPCSDSMDNLKQRWLMEVAWSEPQREEALADRHIEFLSRQGEEAAAAEGGVLGTLRRMSIGLVRPSMTHMAEQAQGALRQAMGGTAGNAPGATPVSEPRLAMLCMETLLKSLYFCKLAYRLETPDSPVSIEHGLSLYPDLQHHELLLEPATDTRVLLVWGRSTLVVAFRGTVTRKNVLTDLEAWSTPHLPSRKNAYGRTLRVHSGFYRAWRTADLGDRLVSRLAQLLEGCPHGARPRALFTGHSLGGALAVLASIEFVRRAPQYAAGVSVYTFGSPRVGNGPFATEHRAAVPDCWSVINNQDPIPRIPKGWFHGAGHRVVVTPRGDLIIKPSTLELSVIFKSGGVAAHHRLPNYSLSLFSLFRAQFDAAKKMEGGALGVTILAGRLDVGQTLVLRYAGLREIMDASERRMPMPVEVYQLRKARKRAIARVEERAISGTSTTFSQDDSVISEQTALELVKQAGAMGEEDVLGDTSVVRDLGGKRVLGTQE